MRAYQKAATFYPAGHPAWASKWRGCMCADAERYAVPHSPGRARHLSPYLCGRRRGRR